MSKQKRRIIANPNCLNCGTHLDSQFCPECGQKNKDYRLSFRDLFSDFLEELLDFDSRVIRSLRTLFTKPGLLTTEYIKGRRISYLPPVRIYLVASVLFFLILSLKSLIPSIQNNKFINELTESGDLDVALNQAIDSQIDSTSDKTELLEGSGLVVIDSDSSQSNMSISIGESAFDVEQGDFLNNFTDNFAKMMFLLLPVAALQLKLLYWRRKKLYIEHLIFSLHVHAFIFSLLILTVILDYKLIMWLVILASLVYLYLAMKNYYSQSHLKTFSKMILLLMSYGFTTMMVMVLTLVATAVGLLVGSSG
jgi:hypothetical protein